MDAAYRFAGGSGDALDLGIRAAELRTVAHVAADRADHLVVQVGSELAVTRAVDAEVDLEDAGEVVPAGVHDEVMSRKTPRPKFLVVRVAVDDCRRFLVAREEVALVVQPDAASENDVDAVLDDRELEEEERPALGHVASRLPILRCEVDEARRPVFDQGRRAHHADRDEAAEVRILVSDGADLVEATHARCGVRGQREVAEGSLRHFELMILR